MKKKEDSYCNMFVLFKRIVKAGGLAFFRNIGLSIATVFIMVTAISLITTLFLFNLASGVLISDIQDRVDVAVYFRGDVLAEDILEVKSEVSKIPEVKGVEYVSKEQALEKFIDRHKDDPVLMESLTEIGGNPFLASLSIKAQQASQYEQIAKFFEGGSYEELIEKVDYFQRKPVIERLFSMTSAFNRGGIIFSIIVGVIAILIAFNTVRIAIYNSSEEISTMRLVGASNRFIRGPFIIQGVIAGFLAILITLLLTFAISYGLDSKVKVISPQISTFGLFVSNFGMLFLIQLVVGVGLGMVSSVIAVRKYLRV